MYCTNPCKIHGHYNTCERCHCHSISIIKLKGTNAIIVIIIIIIIYLFIYLNNFYYDICSKSKRSSSRELMLFTMHITQDNGTKHTQRNNNKLTETVGQGNK